MECERHNNHIIMVVHSINPASALAIACDTIKKDSRLSNVGDFQSVTIHVLGDNENRVSAIALNNVNLDLEKGA